MDVSDEVLKEDKPIGVYVKVNQDGFVTDVNSEIFIKDFTDWKKIDEGYGDRFTHPQGNYFNRLLLDENDKYCLKYEEEKSSYNL